MGQTTRGQRVYCSGRGKRGGCGRTFPLFFEGILPRHTFTAALLRALLSKLLAGFSIKAGAENLALPFSLEAIYAIIRRLRRRLDVVRSLLWRERPAPPSGQTDPLLATLEHLQNVFPQDHCVIAAFQRHFQRPFTG
jgi:hypothetical protein